jgi:hypothetical protein
MKNAIVADRCGSHGPNLMGQLEQNNDFDVLGLRPLMCNHCGQFGS